MREHIGLGAKFSNVDIGAKNKIMFGCMATDALCISYALILNDESRDFHVQKRICIISSRVTVRAAAQDPVAFAWIWIRLKYHRIRNKHFYFPVLSFSLIFIRP